MGFNSRKLKDDDLCEYLVISGKYKDLRSEVIYHNDNPQVFRTFYEAYAQDDEYYVYIKLSSIKSKLLAMMFDNSK